MPSGHTISRLVILFALLCNFAQAEDMANKLQELEQLYHRAQLLNGLWRDVPADYDKARQAFDKRQTEPFNDLYESLKFQLEAGIQQAETQRSTEQIPAYLR